MVEVGDKLFFPATLEVARVIEAQNNIRWKIIHTKEHYPIYQCWKNEMEQMIKNNVCIVIKCGKN
jgi:hypothetical protein